MCRSCGRAMLDGGPFLGAVGWCRAPMLRSGGVVGAAGYSSAFKEDEVRVPRAPSIQIVPKP